MPRSLRTKRSKRNIEAASIVLAAASTVSALPSNVGTSLTRTVPSSTYASSISSSNVVGEVPARITSRFFSTPPNKEEGEEDGMKETIGQTRAEKIERTQSFGPLWHGLYEKDNPVRIHTLMLGTHPSITSLGKSQYFGHNLK